MHFRQQGYTSQIAPNTPPAEDQDYEDIFHSNYHSILYILVYFIILKLILSLGFPFTGREGDSCDS